MQEFANRLSYFMDWSAKMAQNANRLRETRILYGTWWESVSDLRPESRGGQTVGIYQIGSGIRRPGIPDIYIFFETNFYLKGTARVFLTSPMTKMLWREPMQSREPRVSRTKV